MRNKTLLFLIISLLFIHSCERESLDLSEGTPELNIKLS